MTAAIMEIPRTKWENQRKLSLDKSFKDALRDYCKRRWPYHTAKKAAHAFDLSVDQGRSIVAGTASMSTIEKAFKGRPEVAVPVVEEVVGVQLAPLFRQLLMISPEDVSRAVEHEAKASAAWASLASDPDLAGEDRRSWSRAGTLGASPSRSLAERRR